ADEIVIDRHAALGPVDPQLGQYPAASLVEVAAMPGRHDDQTLILADVGRKALRQVEVAARDLLARHMEPARARDLAHLLARGFWTHDHPLMAPELEQLGLPVRVGVPDEERALMRLYPQPRGREAAVEYVPGRPLAPGLPPGREGPRRRPVPPGSRRCEARGADRERDRARQAGQTRRRRAPSPRAPIGRSAPAGSRSPGLSRQPGLLEPRPSALLEEEKNEQHGTNGTETRRPRRVRRRFHAGAPPRRLEPRTPRLRRLTWWNHPARAARGGPPGASLVADVVLDRVGLRQAVDGLDPLVEGGVDADERLPLLWQRVLGEDRLDGALRLAGAAVDALLRVDHEDARRLVDAVDRADVDAG